MSHSLALQRHRQGREICRLFILNIIHYNIKFCIHSADSERILGRGTNGKGRLKPINSSKGFSKSI